MDFPHWWPHYNLFLCPMQVTPPQNSLTPQISYRHAYKNCVWFKSLQVKPGLNWMELLSLRYLQQPLCHLFKLFEIDLERLYTDKRMKITVECETTPGEFEWKGRAVTEMGWFLDFSKFRTDYVSRNTCLKWTSTYVPPCIHMQISIMCAVTCECGLITLTTTIDASTLLFSLTNGTLSTQLCLNSDFQHKWTTPGFHSKGVIATCNVLLPWTFYNINNFIKECVISLPFTWIIPSGS